MRESLDKDRRIEQLTAERDALREEGIGTNTKAAADIYFQLVEELDVPPGGSLVQCIDNMRERLAAMDSEPVALQPELAKVIYHFRDWNEGFPVERFKADYVISWMLANYPPAPPAPVVSADLLHTAASAIEDLLTTKDRTGAGVWFDLPFRLRSAANAQPAPVSPVCTCPSGDGSLRWPCPVHPGNSPVIPDGMLKIGYMFITAEGGTAFSISDVPVPGMTLAGPVYAPAVKAGGQQNAPQNIPEIIPESCTWTFSNYDDHWSGTCGVEWIFPDGGPEENGVKFCPKCGKSVAISATE
ncbi:Eaa1 protein [Klebsiella phage SopranoGao]|uniref:Eaa1 protein n=1 Tax=Klebsiella phage SopranoGao TaxID=2026944 RepID=A0A248SKW5_9CAUD|nr:Eaa1 protein [Klebsiella phage SopranoGao]ASV45065.1 Eaa1 protein [Klebsiella phage SopranoGao]